MTELVAHDLGDGRTVYRFPKPSLGAKRASFPAPFVISDTMDPTVHPCTGKPMTSKAAFRAVTRANGCIEHGTEKAKPRTKTPPDRAAIRESIKRAMSEAV